MLILYKGHRVLKVHMCFCYCIIICTLVNTYDSERNNVNKETLIKVMQEAKRTPFRRIWEIRFEIPKITDWSCQTVAVKNKRNNKSCRAFREK